MDTTFQCFSGSFRENIRAFIGAFAMPTNDILEHGLRAFTVPLSYHHSTQPFEGDAPPAPVTLYVIMENLQESGNLHCDQCKCIGAC